MAGKDGNEVTNAPGDLIPSTSVNIPAGSPTPDSFIDSKANDYHAVDVRIRNVAVQVNPAAGSPFSSLDAFNAKVLHRRVKSAVKDILKDVSAHFPNSSLTAIIGASGSGKTTLLNVIAHRIKDQKFRQAGTITYEAVTHGGSQAAASDVGMAYVLQQDILLPTLTVRETLQYAADLRLSTTKTKAQRQAMVETVIDELGLQKCADTRIGNDAHKGCSGGEKRRTSIGVQLLADQPVLILDEPTTGLDAASAIQVVKALKRLAGRGKTVIMTIHQPRSEIWKLVDNLVLLSRGAPVYAGAVNECLSYFDQLGHSMPAFSNPFDFVIDLAAVDVRSHELERVSLLRVRQLQEAWRDRTLHLSEPDPEKTNGRTFNREQLAGSDNSSLNALVHETAVHLRRTFVVTCRDRLGLLASLIEAVTMGIMTGWIFYQLRSDLAGIRSREGAMYSACALQGYLILLFETYRLTIDIQVYDRERIEGVVKPLSFVLSRRLARLILEDLPVPFIYSVIFYFMAGFRADAGQYFTFFAIQLLLQLITVNLATICVGLNRQFMVASLIANLIFTLQSAACGFFINTKSIPIWLRWMKWVAFVFYSFGAYCTNEFAGHFYDCPSPGGPSDPACKEYTGAYILASLNIPNNWLWRPIVVMVVFVLVFFILSAATLHVLTTEVEMAKTHTSEVSYSEEDIGTTSGRGDGNRTITVTLDHFGLLVETKRLFKTALAKPVFQDIDTTFEPGVLNVIMGPSGSGKSSCLNAMARRLYGSPMTTYRSSGKMLLNGAVAADNVVASICSYVPQDDTGLLPSLTVRETLHFAARLRLPTFLTNEQKVQRAETVLRQLGLKECADTLVGNDLVKGISGGEKRRVSIGIQILTDPRVLLLDEPTSGLDAFTAFSIIEVLKGLADEGRTIIFSIHQPRSDMFKQFGGVLLLAKGGDVVYSGKVDNMLPHFERLGYACPESANPADFALDIVSVEMPKSLKQHGSAEEEASSTSKEIVTSVVPPAAHELTLPASLGVYTRTRLPFRGAFPILVQRGIINLRRQPNLATGRITQLVGLGIVLTAFFTPLRYDYYSVQTRAGYIQYMSSMFFVGMLNAIAMYPSERDIYYHEDRDGTYPLEAFFLYYSALEVPMELIASLLYAVLTVFAVGLPRTAGLFFLMAYTAFCVVSCGESFGILFLTMFSHTGLAVSVMSVVLSISVHLGGVLSIGIDGFLQGVNHISPIKWQVGALMSYSLRGIEFTCTPEQRLSDGSCPIQSGEQVLDLYKLNVNTATCAIALGGVTIGYRLLGYLGLKIRKTDWKGLMRKGRITKS
ncbi:hypothetical protein LTR10_014789 [Elasticomyces elasticus]|uniref:ABC transporter domain-containing protein n=1 Tax=Exophiala sideris TaxID=1016849 RepID=A0ABR0JFY7_9EURO|nr:hypothetical protein LTR10_014789 [Elasticomyces elasticus]KAK5025632.1 hypothetical protein LTS07_007836 [Exophiala sideris]KAK5033158.1 hypothetical protein LTR13_007123 [Exophiala sideris]KAK5063643.1 hypothetical protein LTR69_004349 [Exophiala sideris]KAK5180523.1 hypothetical protein LTR44_006837 [Eurotiomycetes sp. CCFEE 6388]